jgi:hypothetical protein
VPASEGQAARAVTCLFLEDVLAVGVRLGQGLRASVTLSEDRPQSVRVLPPEDAKQDAELRITASTWIAHERRHSRFELEARFDATLSGSRFADQIAGLATRGGWPSEVQRLDQWMPGTVASGGTVEAVVLDLQSSGDWRLEVVLVPRVQQR